MSKVWRIFFEIHAVRKTQTASVHLPHPPTHSPPLGGEGEQRIDGEFFPLGYQQGNFFLCVLASLREPFVRAMVLRSSWAAVRASHSQRRLAALVFAAREDRTT
jgi:hypothetical protein